ncbi:MAG: hypothetical protein IPP36_00975 [Nitrosomonadales bacterium]|nr:hypothetical protein [Nitrosomonadales bacterium]
MMKQINAKNQEDHIVFKHQYLEMKESPAVFGCASSAIDGEGALGAQTRVQ